MPAWIQRDDMTRETKMQYLSVVVPVKNEQATLTELWCRIRDVVAQLELEGFEVIFVDDGSEDDSWEVMKKLAETAPAHVRAARLRRNFGKAAALATGFNEAQGDIIISMDADLQDDPDEIPKFLQKLGEGYDVVSGWKKVRNDPLSKTLPSRIFNRVTALLSRLPLHDFNCGYKAYRRDVVKGLELYGELHRYIPILAYDNGYRIDEIVVAHHPRLEGRSKYGMERYVRGFVDLLTVLSITRYQQKPGHLFGGAGVLAGILGSLILGYLAILWFAGMRPIGNRPLFFVGILLVILSVQLISLGILAELIVKHSRVVHYDDRVQEYRNRSERQA